VTDAHTHPATSRVTARNNHEHHHFPPDAHRSHLHRDEGRDQTTEFITYVVILIAMFLASAVVDSNEDGQGFGAVQVWLYATLLTIGYMISRGLAKSGSREHYDRDERNDRSNNR
jgi:hypothetical protein